MSAPPLQRYIDAQNESYDSALAEIKRGRKQGHWMWYVFPQIKGLGLSSTSAHYGIQNFEEASNYLKNSLLNKRLIEISKAVFQLEHTTAHQIFGSPDDKKLRSSMTLFSMVPNSGPIFKDVLKKFFNGQYDVLTLDLIEETM